MAVKKGFKLTEVGEIPEDWEVKKIRDVAYIDPELLSSNTPKNYSFQYISLEDVKDGNLKSYEQQIFCTAPSRARKKIQRGDILFGTVRPNLHSHLLFSMASSDWVCSTGFTVLRTSEGHDNRLIFHNFLSKRFDRQINSIISGSNYPAINTNQIRDLYLPIPSSNQEQAAIAAALSDADSLISSLEQLIAKKRLIKQGAMQELLTGKKRLPGLDGDWIEISLGDALKVHHGKDQKEIASEIGIYPILGTGGELGRTNFYLSEGPSVLIGRKGTIDNPQYVESPFWTIDTLFYTDFFICQHPKIFYYLFCMMDWRRLNEASGVPSLSANTIENIRIKIPEANEQAAIAAVLSDMDEEIDALEAKLEKARKIREGMMAELLTGRIRLV